MAIDFETLTPTSPERDAPASENSGRWVFECRVTLDKSKGAVKDKNILGGTGAPLALPEREVEDQDSGISRLNHPRGVLNRIPNGAVILATRE